VEEALASGKSVAYFSGINTAKPPYAAVFVVSSTESFTGYKKQKLHRKFTGRVEEDAYGRRRASGGVDGKVL
jgi:hypothetical protein